MTLARARLLVGIGCVGLWVILSYGITLQAGSLFDDIRPEYFGTVVALSILFTAIHALVQLPWDVLEGGFIPKIFAQRQTFSTLSLLKQIAIHFFVTLLLLSTWLSLSPIGFFCVVTFLGIFSLKLQGLLARWVGGLTISESSVRDGYTLERWSSPDIAFQGGIYSPGIGRTIVIPEQYDIDKSDLFETRRADLLLRGSYRRGASAALALSFIGALISLILTGPTYGTIDGYLIYCGYVTIWSFVLLLVLPSLSRESVYVSDKSLLRNNIRKDRLFNIIRGIDLTQDNEPTKSKSIEYIFHPIPSVTSRLHRLEAEDEREPMDLYNVSRIALLLSQATGGFLFRSVHGNCGRPSMWWMPSAD